MEELTPAEMEKVSRRKIIDGLGAGLASLATAQVFAAPVAQHKEDAPTPPLEDPTKKYPQPPFKSQSQPWPEKPRKYPSTDWGAAHFSDYSF